ncbi:transcription factor IIIB 70 kDa subunit [Kluyveromyces marxianus DMKU3-1042]|uniref:Transcription factor IIIB 70 kDa subunit n=1 Tax=Kluyveromyces marxianus (strain DMKU3-1042 / BCC 29191 / NBRC 104275) TaxID=1003335 RepID=W0T3I3_KLUMD|nr:transcription factor IIIB 70 kDa subunit [Kluyveromyces marxianus DMKU3-1042]BAO37955.1 transcription factor IIIB 70 kDa subunit [Kluyveromyces marxianus DMKU3-1042]
MASVATRKCKNCGSTDFGRDISNTTNELICKECGLVTEENSIVSEVTFGETSNGAAVIQGSFVSANQAHPSFMSHSGQNALMSRETTLNNARRKLKAVSYALNIPEYVTDAAFQWYKLALSHNFVQGRKSQNVIAACLYIACRKERTHHMLIDFSSRLQVSVYSIGATFLKLAKKLHIVNLPLADPSLFIQHFAEKLELGDRKIKVIKDAVKLAQTMSRDWMYEGRRPAGIAGACLLLACRMNNLRRTHSEIVAISHVAEETLQQRLNEFKNTTSAKMSVKEFRNDETELKDGERSKDAKPPSFEKNRLKEKKIKDSLDTNEMLETSEEALSKNPILTQVLGAQELSSKEVLYYLKQLSERRKTEFSRIKATHGIDGKDLPSEENNEDENEKKRTIDDIDGYSLEKDPYRPKNLHLLPTTASLLSKVSDHPENLEDVDDAELDSHLLDEEASKLKERIWIDINGDYLLEQESKRLKQEADLASGNTSLRKKRTKRAKKQNTDAASIVKVQMDGLPLDVSLDETTAVEVAAAGSVNNILQKNSFSKKINYDAIDGLFGQK